MSVVGGVRSLFDCFQLLLRSIRFWFLRWISLLSGSIRVFSAVDLFAEKRSLSGVPPLALISQFVCHNCSVPGFTDGAGFRFWGGCVSC